MSKPLFVFFKMLGCGHCVTFYESPTLETSVWAQLVKDKELSSKVDFVLREWGISKNSSGGVENRKLPDEYKFVNYGPYFYLQNATDSTQGFEMKDVRRTHDDIKAWILGKLQSEPKLLSKAAPRTAPTNIQKPVPSHIKQMLDQKQQQAMEAQAHAGHQHAQSAPQLASVQQPTQVQQAMPVQQPRAYAPVQVQSVPQLPTQIQQEVQAKAPVQAPVPQPQAQSNTGPIKRMILKKQEEVLPARKFVAKNHRK